MFHPQQIATNKIKRINTSFTMMLHHPSLLTFAVLAATLPCVSPFSVGKNGIGCRRAATGHAPRTSVHAVTGAPSFMSSEPLPPSQQVLTAEKVAELIEVSFVNACLQLAQGFVDVLKLLIAAVKAGYEIGVSPVELIATIDAIPDQTAGRPLMPEEVGLRNTWIQVVYLTLASVNHRTEAAVDMILDDDIKATYTSIIPDMAAIKTAGEQLQIDLFLELHKHSFSGLDNPIQKAIVSHSLRVMWITLTVLEEEARCSGDFARPDAPPMPPTPPITGAF
jgi:hypothetical protein